MSKIEWTGLTLNPIVGCSVFSPGCTHCYAMWDAWRKNHNPLTPQYHGLTKLVNGKPVWTGKVNLVEHKLIEPLSRQKPTTYFVNSMGDLFHEAIPEEHIDLVFASMALSPQHIFQVLTKRSQRMLDYFSNGGGRRQHVRNRIAFEAVPKVMNLWYPDWTKEESTGKHRARAIAACSEWPLSNVWLGVSAERQKEYDERKEHLRASPAAVRFFSMEPLLGPIKADYLGDWVIAGGESGSDHPRPMHPQWPRDLRDKCARADVPFFFKQWGSWAPKLGPSIEEARGNTQPDVAWPDGTVAWGTSDEHGGPGEALYFCGRKKAAPKLDGRLHREFPVPPIARAA